MGEEGANDDDDDADDDQQRPQVTRGFDENSVLISAKGFRRFELAFCKNQPTMSGVAMEQKPYCYCI